MKSFLKESQKIVANIPTRLTHPKQGEREEGEGGRGPYHSVSLHSRGEHVVAKVNDDITSFERICLHVQVLRGALAGGGTDNNSN